MILAISFNSNAQMDKSQYAVEYLELIQYEKIINNVLQEMNNAPVGNTKDTAEFFKIIESIMGWNAVKNDLKKMVMKHFSIDDLKALNAFLKTKIGQKLSSKNLLIERDLSKLFAIRMQNFDKLMIEKLNQ